MLKNNGLYKMIISIAVLLIAIAIGYYYIYHLPKLAADKQNKEAVAAEARKECAEIAKDKASNRFMADEYKSIDQKEFDLYYKNCLKLKGLEK